MIATCSTTTSRKLPNDHVAQRLGGVAVLAAGPGLCRGDRDSAVRGFARSANTGTVRRRGQATSLDWLSGICVQLPPGLSRCEVSLDRRGVLAHRRTHRGCARFDAAAHGFALRHAGKYCRRVDGVIDFKVLGALKRDEIPISLPACCNRRSSLYPSSVTPLLPMARTPSTPLDVIGVEDPIRPFNFIPRVILPLAGPARMTEPECLA